MWEYKTETFSCQFDNEEKVKRKCNELLSKYGKDGYELVNFQTIGIFGSLMVFIFKRELQEMPAEESDDEEVEIEFFELL